MGIKSNALKAAFMLAGFLILGEASAQVCCPNGGSGVRATGLGESHPNATNLALDAAWSIYEFQRDGVTYLQINDIAGTVRAVVARIDDALWVVPMGKDVNRVSVPTTNSIWTNKATYIANKAVSNSARMVYRTANFTVHVESQANGEHWKVSPS
ncbi:hypothetical protein ACQR53_11130 [Xanthomonas oryzae]|uniref:hypothetical protein n=1 Tax=Xanthomonas oryzae TaxID=347 RepID=UPI0006AC63BE|nr:hypothetical protein [Xanthomonas oryzae]QBG88050.1 hypothetical protein EYC54_10225 [Xanthomonas oryzae]QBG92354.1 hypothetical protein EYR26_13210 [Xanthomonas oryzae]QBH00176.1 hypothetical protein EYC56_13830 [Xanthomonas oryzae]QBH03568.1 hypothetical protein EYC57_09345 [Xanthomonas oryzae]UNE64330.1 hypothetical protein MML47_09630 [Xanthomonas oryzae]